MRRPHRQAQSAQGVQEALALTDDRLHPLFHFTYVSHGQQPGDLLEGVEVVGQDHPLQGGHHGGGGDGIAQAQGGQGPRLGEGAGDHEGHVVAHHLQRRPPGELAVGLVDDHQAGSGFHHGGHGGGLLAHAGGVVGRAQEHQVGRGGAHQAAGGADVDGEVAGPPGTDHLGPGDVGDVGVEGVGGLEGEGPPALAAVGQAERLDHLVGPVGAQHLVGRHPVEVGHRLAQAAGVAVRVAVVGHGGDGGGQVGHQF
ncbi:MAG TPA: hypothetical protein VKU91_09285, partial [Acidimicrobiales bacterium]|nr:hypothetical protein [Acidimicrobiales bacterium]